VTLCAASLDNSSGCHYATNRSKGKIGVGMRPALPTKEQGAHFILANAKYPLRYFINRANSTAGEGTAMQPLVKDAQDAHLGHANKRL
jgi:hypothetical protein